MPRLRSRAPRAFPIILVLALFLGSGCAELAQQLTNVPKLKKSDLKFELAQSSKVYDRNGRLMTTLHETENRTVIPFARIPDHVVDAVVSIEDERFYEHEGVDLRAIARALITNAASGEIKEGGSTITQQLVKNVIIAPGETAAKTIERKINEASLSRQLEEKLSKEEILEAYLNTVYFGEGAYGIQEAAKTYFGSSAADLTLAEAATLAGVIQSPETYDPYKHPQDARDRRDLVISKMLQLGYIEQSDADRARKQKIHLQQASEVNEYLAPYFMDYVQRLITYDPRFAFMGETVEERTNRLFQGGLRIHTTVDLDMQAAAEDAVSTILPNASDPHAALVAIDPNTGEVRAMVGGRDWFATAKEDPYAKLNLAILAEPGLGCVQVEGAKKCENRAPGSGRQAGSAFKPFALAAAIDNGIPLSKTYKAGSSITIPGANAGADYVVHNYEGGSFGDNLSLLEATVFSVNVVYAQVIEEVGPEAVAETAYDMGINTSLCESCLSSALGSNEVNALDMASGYGTLATNGEHHPPVAITRVETAAGEVLYEDETEPEQALDPAVAYLTTTALEQVIQRGTAAGNGQIGRPAAGKTGTAQEYRDAWFVGYTPDLVAAVWMGYPEGQIEMKPSCAGSTSACRVTRSLTGSGVTGGSFPTQIWAAFMTRALRGIAASSFVQPSGGFTSVTIDTRTGCLATKITPDEFRASATFAAGTQPKKACKFIGEKTRVPNVVGFPFDEAVDTLQSAGFPVQFVEEQTKAHPPGIVLEQDPAGDSKAPQGSTVTLTVSAKDDGSSDDDDTIAVPNVVGMTAHEAQDALKERGFTIVTIREAQSDKGQAKKNKGKVWQQSPSSGTEARRGSTVTIWVNP